MGFPPYGVCPTNKLHCICFKSKSFIPSKSSSCDKCFISFYKIYYNKEVVNPHYYHCAECDRSICFNCAQSANISDRHWNVRWLPCVGYYRLPQLFAPKQSEPMNIDGLKLSDIFNNMNDNILQKCIKKIIKLFGGNKAMLDFIINNAAAQQLREIRKKVAKLCTIENDMNPLESIQKDCMIHIIGYLNKTDVSQFKLSSKKLAILCIEEMRKIPIKSINGNNMLINHDINGIDPCNYSFVTKTRYNGEKLFRSLYTHWSQTYNIDENNILLFQNHKLLNFSSSIYTNFRLLASRYQCPYLILDKTKTVILERNCCKIFDKLRKNIDWSYNYKLMILRYFDIMNQTVATVQYIVFPAGIGVAELFKYVENAFIAIDGVDSKWYDDLQHILKQMNNNPWPGEAKLSLYICRRTTKQRCSLFDRLAGNVYTLQINDKHPWFITGAADKLNIIKTKCKENNIKFESNVVKVYENMRGVLVKMKINKNALKLCMKHHYANRLNKYERQIFDCDIQTTYDLVNISKFEFRINAAVNQISVLKQKISKIYGGIIAPKYIQFDERMFDDDRDNDYAHMDKYDCYIICNVYDVNNQNTLYNVNIYTPTNGAYPFYSQHTQCKTITIAYKAQFKTDDFIQDLFGIMLKSETTDHIFYEYFKDLIYLYYYSNYDNKDDDIDDSKDCDLKQPEKIKRKPCLGMKFILHERPDCFQNHYEILRNIKTLNTYTFDRHVVNLDLFMIRVKPVDGTRNIKLQIKFKTNYCYIGLPLYSWINKYDTLQSVINKYMDNAQCYIQFCYRIKEDNDGDILYKIFIAKKEWINYQLYFQMDLPNEYLLFQFKEINHTNVKIPRYTDEIYRQFDLHSCGKTATTGQ